MSEEIGIEPQELQSQVMEAVEDVKEELAKEKVLEQQTRQWFNLIGLSTGILSALAAIASMQAGGLSNEGMLAQINATDKWALYQAQSTKRHLNESTVTVLESLQKPIPVSLTAGITKLRQEQKATQSEAQKLEAESRENLRRHELFAKSVAALQVGISMGAVAALLRKRVVWYLGLGMGAIGISLMVVGTLPGNPSYLPSPSVRVES